MMPEKHVAEEQYLQRYYFIICYSGHEYGDGEGAALPDEAAARAYALRVVRELIQDGGCDDTGLRVIVVDETGRQVFVTPFAHDRAIR
jgi:uncharacterized protein DUF6894